MKAHLKNSMMDYTIEKVEETKILDVLGGDETKLEFSAIEGDEVQAKFSIMARDFLKKELPTVE